MAKRLMLGNEAVARGLYEAGCRIISSYPGTPSTEITEFVSTYGEVYSEWAPNEKVAMEVAIGASIGGARSFCAMKHVGLNVAADPLFTSGYTGVNGGMVIAVADDPGMHSSQNEQDSRYYAIGAKVPMLEPADSAECKEFTKLAFEISERFDTPVIIRLSTRISHSQSLVEQLDREEKEVIEYKKNVAKYVMMPGNARGRHVVVEERTKALIEYAESCPVNTVEDNGSDIGIITAGTSYQYAKEALGDTVNYLKIGMANPMPVKMLQDFADKYKTVYVIEELEPIIKNHCIINGIKLTDAGFSNIGEISQEIIREKILGKSLDFTVLEDNIPVRPPVLCPGCPHRGLFYAISNLDLYISGDIGCYTLGATSPLFGMDSTICMGASVSGLHGFNKATGRSDKSVAVIGDSTFIHSGITGLINIVYNKGLSTVIIVDNSITGMTGHQDNPSTGKTLKGEITNQLSLEGICKAAGVNRIAVVDPGDIAKTREVVMEELKAEEPSVVIARRPCALLKSVKAKPAFTCDTEKCKKCGLCMKIGCPAISKNDDGTIKIDKTLCVGCGLCLQLCKFGAIKEGE